MFDQCDSMYNNKPRYSLSRSTYKIVPNINKTTKKITTRITHVDFGSGNRVIDVRRHTSPYILEQFVTALRPLDLVKLVFDYRVVASQYHCLAQFGVSGDDGRQLEQVFAI